MMRTILSIRSIRRFIPLAVAALLVPAAQAQTGEDALRLSQRMPAVGARMVGLGGAGLAGVADFAALYSNPAGLGYFQHSEFAGGLNAFAANEEATYRVPGQDPNVTDRDIRDTRLGNLAYVYRAPTVRGSFVVAAAYNQVHSFDRNLAFGGANASSSVSESFLPYADEFEVVQDDEGRNRPRFFNTVPELAYRGGAIEFLFENVGTGNELFYQAVAPGTTIDQEGDVLEEGRMSELNLGGAVEAARGVMVGVSANLVFGRYRFESRFDEIDTRGENTAADYEVILDDGNSLRGFDALTYRTGFESDLTGFNLRAGVSAEVAPAIRIGLTLETPTFFSVTEDYFSELETLFDEGGSLSDEQRGTFEYQITTPWRLGGGVAYESAALLVSADLEYIDWSQLSLDASGDDFTDVNRTIRENLEPVLQTRLGAEYRLGALSLRGGLALQPDPRNYELEFASGNTDRSKTFFSAGVGYRFAEQFSVDVGWMQSRFDDLYRPYGDVQAEPPVVEEQVVRNQFVAGFRVAF